MDNSLHYLLMADHFIFQKELFANIKDTGLSLGQPKILDYLREHDGSVQKDIADACHIEPASLTSILSGMERAELIMREMRGGNRRSLYVSLTAKGKEMSERVENEFSNIEQAALKGFSDEEKALLNALLLRVRRNLYDNK